MQLTKIKKAVLPVSILLPVEDKRQFCKGMIGAIDKSRKGSAIRSIQCAREGEEIDGHKISSTEEKRRYLIGQRIVLIGRAFGATGKIPNDIMSAVVSFIDQNFSFLSVEEIGLAFSLAAAGQIEADVSLYGKPINLDWISRVLRAYKKERIKAVAVISKTEDEFSANINFDEEKEIQKRRSAHLRIIDSIVCAFRLYEERMNVDLLFYQFEFLQKIGGIVVTDQQKIEAFKKAKVLLIRNLQIEKGASQIVATRKAIEQTICDLNTGIDNENVKQRKIAINIIFQDFFCQMTINGDTIEGLKDDLQKKYYRLQNEMTIVRYIVTLTKYNGGEKTTRPMLKSEMKELFSQIQSDVSGVKIEIV